MKKKLLEELDIAKKCAFCEHASETLTPDCVLCDDVEVGTAADENVAVYTAGCFDPDKVTVAESYTISQTDKDNLRMRGIVFKAAAAAN